MTVMMREWRLRTLLTALLVAAALLTFLVVGAAILAYRLPQIGVESRQSARQSAVGLMQLAELVLDGMESRIKTLARLVQVPAGGDAQTLLDATVAEGGFEAVYMVRADGKIHQVGLANQQRRESMLGADFSGNAVFRAVRGRSEVFWSDRYLSPLTGGYTTGVAIPAGEYVLIGEISADYLSATLGSVAKQFNDLMLVLDRRGLRVVDHGLGEHDRLRDWGENMRRWEGGLPAGGERVQLESGTYHLGTARSDKLGWVFLVAVPAGMDNPRYGVTLWLVLGGFFSAILLAAAMAPLWARTIARPAQEITALTREIAAGNYDQRVPRGRVLELNQLATDLELMVVALLERQQALASSEERFQSIFEASPLAMAVLTADSGVCTNNDRCLLVDVNHAWLQKFGRQRERVIGRSLAEIELWSNKDGCALCLPQLVCESGQAVGEAWMMCTDGSQILCEMTARPVTIDGAAHLVWVLNDITDKRVVEEELRQLNVELETRVKRRTRDLADANDNLQATLDQLKLAQRELVHAEKLAALGGVVAGVAHELNTPIGNALMAVSALSDELGSFQKALASGLRRSVLEAFVEKVSMATRIAQRNLERAGDLVSSFKQVAVDQTSSQRRKFELREVVDEILITLHPMLKRTPFEVQLDIPQGLVLDSYPGPFGQVLTNLINNAVTHAFEGNERGVIAIAAQAVNGDRVRINVRDDGHGVPESLIPHLFDPFVTTRRGRGGTGLGLHISYNTVTGILGGQITVHSVLEQGTEFVMILPLSAPKSEETINV